MRSLPFKNWKERLLYEPQANDTRKSRILAVTNSLILHVHPAKIDAPALHFTYTWALGDSDIAHGMVVTHTYPQTGTYTAVVTASNGLGESRATTVVTVDEVINGLSLTHDGPTSLGDPTTLTATVATGSHVSYLWSFGDGGLGLGPVMMHTYPAAQVYSAVVTASNSVSALTATAQVEIQSRFRSRIYLPVVMRQ